MCMWSVGPLHRSAAKHLLLAQVLMKTRPSQRKERLGFLLEAPAAQLRWLFGVLTLHGLMFLV